MFRFVLLFPNLLYKSAVAPTLRASNNEHIRFLKQTALALTKSKFKFVLLQRGTVRTFDSRAIIMQVAGAKSPILPLKKAKSQEMEKNHEIPQQWRLL
jgi:hypothetical protein